jgi:hypothetical protein
MYPSESSFQCLSTFDSNDIEWLIKIVTVIVAQHQMSNLLAILW